MKELVDRFLNYIYQKNSHSQDTVDSYRRDLEQLMQYLTSQGIDSFEKADRLVFFEFYLYVSIRESGQTSNYCA